MNLENEWIVEQFRKTTDGRIITTVIGKILFPNIKDSLTNDELEDIWDICNYGPANYDCLLFDNYEFNFPECFSIYNFMKTYHENDCFYIIITPNIDYVNDDIFVRKHYEPMNGYWLKKIDSKDTWVNTSKDEALNYYKSVNKRIFLKQL